MTETVRLMVVEGVNEPGRPLWRLVELESDEGEARSWINPSAPWYQRGSGA